MAQVLILSDLECDYINAQQCCSKLNIWVIPKLAAHTFLTLVLLFTGHFWLFLTNLPFVAYLFYEYFTIPAGKRPFVVFTKRKFDQIHEIFRKYWSLWSSWDPQSWNDKEAFERLHGFPRVLSHHILCVSLQVSIENLALPPKNPLINSFFYFSV